MRTSTGAVSLLRRWRSAWTGVFRRTPIGILVLGVMLLLLGASFVVGSVLLALEGSGSVWSVVGMLLVAGPVTIYAAVNLLWLRPRAWHVVVVLLVLLIASSLARAAAAQEIPIAPISELVVEAGALLYLLRPRVRHAFRR